MSGWGSGYVTDIAYTANFYGFQSPHHLALACLLRSVRPPPIGSGLSYLELGCGRGHGALVVAASNPDWTVTAIDFNPAHIAEARQIAHEAGLGNATFLEIDLADPASLDRLPEADVTTLHGVWSWVAPAVRHGIVAVLKAKLRPGGLVQISYNSLPGSQGALGLQRLVRHGGTGTGRSDRQAVAGMQLAKDLAATGAPYLHESNLARTTLDRSALLVPEYLAHEYMNQSWAPCFHMDVCRDLDAARLEWAAPSSLIASFPELVLSPAQRDIVARYDDPLMRELIGDMCVEKALRNDVFVRGRARITTAERDAALRSVRLAARVPRGAFKFAIPVPGGEAALGQALYAPVADRLAQGPCTVGDLLDLPGLPDRSRGNPAELAGMLVGSDQAMAVGPASAGDGTRAAALNQAIGARHEAAGALGAAPGIASTTLGAGWACSMLDLAVWCRIAAGHVPDAAAMSTQLMAHGSAEDRARMAAVIDTTLHATVPLWRTIGLLPQA